MARTRLQGVEVAGIKIAIEAPPGARFGAVDERFRCPPHDPDMYVGVRIGTPDASVSESITYRTERATFEIGRRGRDCIVAVHGSDGCERVASFDESFSVADVVVSPGAAGADPLGHPLDEIAVAHRIVDEGGLLVRASASIRNRKAILFLGCDAALASVGVAGEGGPLACSDRDSLAIRLTRGGAILHGTPWHTSSALAAPVCAKIEAVHLLEPDSRLCATRIDSEGAAAALLGYVLAPVHDADRAGRCLEIASRIAARVPFIRVGQPQRPSVIPFDWGRRHATMGFAPPAAAL